MTPICPTSGLTVFATGLDHAEGICLAPDGHLYASGEQGQLYRIEADGTPTELLRTDGFLLGLAADADNRVYACDQTHHVVWRMRPDTGEYEPFTHGLPDRPVRVPNWGAFDGAGNYYFPDSGGWKDADGLVWVVRPGGVTEVWTEQTRDFPNGCAVAPDGRRLYVLEGTPGRLVEVPIRPDGGAGTRKVLAELPGLVPDGVAVETDGSLLIACYRPDAIYRWNGTDELQAVAEDPEGTILAAPTNLAFVGKDLNEWASTNLGRWHLTRGGGVNGTPLFYPSREQLAA